MIHHQGDGDPAGTCAYCGRTIDVVRYKLRPGATAHGDPADLEPVPFCSEDWLYLSEGRLPPRHRGRGRAVPRSTSPLARTGCLAGAALSAALVVLAAWLLVTRVFV